MFVFWKIWRTLSSCHSRFEIRPFALLKTNCAPGNLKKLYFFSLISRRSGQFQTVRLSHIRAYFISLTFF